MRYSDSILRPTFVLLVVTQLCGCYFTRSQTPDHDGLSVQEERFGDIQDQLSSPKVSNCNSKKFGQMYMWWNCY